MRVSLKRIEAHRLRARAGAVRDTDRRAWWVSEVDRARRERLASLMDEAADRLEREATAAEADAELRPGVCL